MSNTPYLTSKEIVKILIQKGYELKFLICYHISVRCTFYLDY
jgi:hypothetical protein